MATMKKPKSETPAPAKKGEEHWLYKAEECSYGNSGINYSEGYNFFRCSCGRWREAHYSADDAVMGHYNHVVKVKLVPPVPEANQRSKEEKI